MLDGHETATRDRIRYFLDTEFIEDGVTIDLISIGVVCEDGREFYAESSQVPWHRANDWVNENVRPHLHGTNPSHRDGITAALLDFTAGTKPEFWGYYADYDWVVVAQLFGTMMDLPTGWPMFCMDLKQWAVMLGDPHLPEQTTTEHHALADARWNRDTWLWLRDLAALAPSTTHVQHHRPHPHQPRRCVICYRPWPCPNAEG